MIDEYKIISQQNKIVEFFEKNLSNESNDYNYVLNSFCNNIGYVELRDEVKKKKRFNKQVDCFQYDKYQNMIYILIHNKRQIERSINRLGHRIAKNIHISNQKIYKFGKLIFVLHYLNNILKEILPK